ncbi:MAG TPA: ABC transporter permease [Thermomicrobiaceae bacterium]|nr:ABC transporter permease [Thermomicrobiaceae bacterium]
MLRYVIARLVGIVGVLLAVSIITFLMMHAVPGGPFDATESQQVPVPQSVRDALAHKYQLDQPLYRQYLSYIGNVLHGDLGVSFKFGEPVTQFLARSWPVTIQLGAMTFVLSMVVGVVLGTISALRPNSIVDYVTSITVVTFIVMPTFVVAVLMIILFAVELKWLPTGGWGSPREAIMPVIAYALGPTATVARYTRASLLDALRADYVRTAKAKGLRQRAIVLRHAFKNALIPMLTVIGPLFAWMVTGSFFIETIFRVPGIGNELTLSIYNRDYPVIMALSLVWCTVIALAYLATDLLYAVADPRVRLSGGQS